MDGLKSLAPFGTLVSYNIVQGPPTEDTFQVMRQLLEKSLAIRLTLGSEESTLTDERIQVVVDSVLSSLTLALQARLR